MTTVLLVRHAQCARTAELLFGREIDPPLDEVGQHQAEAVAKLVARHRHVVVEASPRRRAQQTAAAIGRAVGSFWRTSDSLDEVDFGDWAGQSFAALERDPRWRRWNTARASARTPSGTTMRAIQCRIVDYIALRCADVPAATIAIVSHAEPIRAALLFYLDRPLECWADIQVPPASVSTLVVDADGRASHTQVVDVGVDAVPVARSPT